MPQFLETLTTYLPTMFTRQTPENLEGLEADGILDLIADIDEYNTTLGARSPAPRIGYTLQTNVVRVEPGRMPVREARLVLRTPAAVAPLTTRELRDVVDLFEPYAPNAGDVVLVVAKLSGVGE